ncbi:MAG: DUF1097 domain-containing protein [Rhodococcus sp. (in: high G+C Gram-positive bacteria)]
MLTLIRRVPQELTIALLAALTALFTLAPLNFGPWAIFLSWAPIYLIGGPTRENITSFWRTLPVGAACGLAVLVLFQHYGTVLGSSTAAGAAMLVVICFVMTTVMMYLGRIPALTLLPGMFIGFASYLATALGGFGFDPGNPYAAFVSVVVMSLLGPALAWLAGYLTTPHAPSKPPVPVRT